MMEAVETCGRWPDALREGEPVLLPKGGSADTLDRRPITLLAIIYRLWAGLCATGLRDWMRNCI